MRLAVAWLLVNVARCGALTAVPCVLTATALDLLRSLWLVPNLTSHLVRRGYDAAGVTHL